MCTGVYRENGIEKLNIRYVHTKWMAPNKCCGIFFFLYQYFFSTGAAKYTRASPLARKMLLFSSIIITIVFYYETTKIYSPSSIFKSLQKIKHSILLKEILTQIFA